MFDGLVKEYERILGRDLTGYQYRDLPRMTEPYFSDLIEIIGEDNIIWITQAEYGEKDGRRSKRGQMLVSPEGIENVRAYRDNKEKKNSGE